MMGRQEYDTYICPKCGKKLSMSSREMRKEVYKRVGVYDDLTIHFMHKLLEKLKEGCVEG